MFIARVPLRDHWKSEIFWELRCNRNSTGSFLLRLRRLIERAYLRNYSFSAFFVFSTVMISIEFLYTVDGRGIEKIVV